MDESSIQKLEAGSEKDVVDFLVEFNKKNAQAVSLPEMNFSQKKHLMTVLFERVSSLSSNGRCPCLESIRILSRERSVAEQLFTRSHLATLLQLAGLMISEDQENNTGVIGQICCDPKVIVESQKCLCNAIYNSNFAQKNCCNNGCIEGILLRLRTYKDPDLPHEVKFFDMRMLFLLTALCAEIRPKVRSDLHGLTYLMEVLDLILKENVARGDRCHNRTFRKSSRRGRGGAVESVWAPCLSDPEVDMACEVLKVLFNLTVNVDKYSMEEEEEAHYMRLVSILHDMLLGDAKNPDKKEELQSHTINLLTNMPMSSYEELLTPVLKGSTDEEKDDPSLVFDGMNVEAIGVLLSFLDNRLTKTNKTCKEILSPILTTLSECSRANSVIRKFLRKKVLPPLKDVLSRPEEGCTLRNRLVKLMTSPVFDVKELVADFLFVLCKENVGRLIKYTGYGNAAGLLANRGLMLGGRGSTNYSSDSEDSDTEEYLTYRDKINPVLGCYQEPPPNPMEGMTEEQKEYEAVQLVNMMDRMSREGVIQPMKVGTDGKPVPLDHVLQMLPPDNPSTQHSDDSE